MLAVHGKKKKPRVIKISTTTRKTLINDHQTLVSPVPPVLEGPLWESLNYTLGSHVALLCEASGVPVPSITWLKDGTPIGKLSWKVTKLRSRCLYRSTSVSVLRKYLLFLLLALEKHAHEFSVKKTELFCRVISLLL